MVLSILQDQSGSYCLSKIKKEFLKECFFQSETTSSWSIGSHKKKEVGALALLPGAEQIMCKIQGALTQFAHKSDEIKQ